MQLRLCQIYFAPFHYRPCDASPTYDIITETYCYTSDDLLSCSWLPHSKAESLGPVVETASPNEVRTSCTYLITIKQESGPYHINPSGTQDRSAQALTFDKKALP